MDNEGSGIAWVIGAVITLIVGLIVFFHSFAVVGPNQVGVLETASAVDKNQTPLSPGWHGITPFVNDVSYVTTNQQSHPFSEVSAAAKNQQAVFVDGTIAFHIDPKFAGEFVIQTGGSDDPGVIINRTLWPAFQDYLKEAVPTYADFQDVFTHRPEIRDAVKSKLQGKTDKFGLYVDDIYLTDVHPDPSFKAAINAAATAAQDKVRAQNQAAAQIATAQGDAEANRIRQASITQQTLDQKALDNQTAMINKWDGHLPQVSGSGNVWANLNIAK